MCAGATLLNDLTRSIDFALQNAERGVTTAGASDAENTNICQTRILTKGIEQLRELRDEVLRQRAQMKLKVRAMSSESKASAYIIGALPFLVFGMICYINFNYMKPFFTPDPAGLFGLSTMQVVGIGGMCWMGIGAFIMAQMVNFEI